MAFSYLAVCAWNSLIVAHLTDTDCWLCWLLQVGLICRPNDALAYGQLGYEDMSARGDGPNEMNDALAYEQLG